LRQAATNSRRWMDRWIRLVHDCRSRMCGARGVHLGQQCNGVFWFRWA
jgi:hypothetical protein